MPGVNMRIKKVWSDDKIYEYISGQVNLWERDAERAQGDNNQEEKLVASTYANAYKQILYALFEKEILDGR